MTGVLIDVIPLNVICLSNDNTCSTPDCALDEQGYKVNTKADTEGGGQTHSYTLMCLSKVTRQKCLGLHHNDSTLGLEAQLL